MTETLDFFGITIKTLPWQAISRKWGFAKKFYSQYSSRLLEKKRLPQKGTRSSVWMDDHAAVDRDEAYFRYKTFSDTLVIRVEEAMVWISIKNALLIGDMQAVDETNFKKVMEQLKKLAKELGIKQIQFHVSPGTRLHKLFSGISNPIPSFPALFQDFGSPVPPEKIKFTYADMDSF
jgi:hypothetical protein